MSPAFSKCTSQIWRWSHRQFWLPWVTSRHGRKSDSVPLSKYNKYFGGKKNAARKTFEAMIAEYGRKKGKRVFYATKNKRLKHYRPNKISDYR